MRRPRLPRWAPLATIGAAVVYLIELALGARWPSWYLAVWPTLTMSWAALVLFTRSNRIAEQQLIKTQRAVIEQYRELFGQTFRDAGRWN